MADVGEIRAKLVADTDQFEAGMQRAADATGSFSDTAEKNLSEVNNSLKGMKWAEAGRGIAQVGGALKNIGDDFLAAAEKADDLADSLKGAFGDSADQVAQWSEQIGTAFGVFSSEQVGGAAVALEKFGIATETNLKRVADIAAGSGQSLEGVAAAFGKFEKFGDSKSLMALQKQVGVTAEELGKFGAVLDSNGKILADTPARAEAARAAMEQLLDEKFGGAMERQSDASAQLAGNMELLKQEVGAGALELKENMAPAMLSFVQGIRDLPAPMKGAIGLLTEFGGQGLQAAGGAIQMAANLKNLGLGLSSLQGALGAAQGALGALAGPGGLMVVAAVAVVALAVAFHQYTVELENANKAAEDLLTTEEKRTRALHANKELIGKTADEYRKLGKTAKDADDLISGLQEQSQVIRAGKAEADLSPEQKAQLAKIQQQQAVARAAREDLLKDQKGPVYNKTPAPTSTPVKVEESEKQRQAREKKQAADADRQRKKAEADQKAAERQRMAAQRAADRRKQADEAKRERDRAAADRRAEQRRRADERKRDRDKAKGEKSTQRQQTQTAQKTEQKKAETKAAAEPATAAAAVPGFFDKFELDDNTKAFKEVAARNAARAAGQDVFLGGSRAGDLGAAVAAASGSLVASSPGQPATGAEVGKAVADSVKDAVPETIRVILEQRGEGRTQIQTQDVKRGEPVRFEGRPLGGPTA